MELLPPTEENIGRAAAALRSGEVVAYPTETVYGLGVDPFDGSALERLYAIKQRDPSHPVLMIVSSMAQLETLVREIPPRARALAERFWPGPLSMLFPAAEGLSGSVCGTDGRVCVRWTASPISQSLCAAFDGPVVSTSANLSGRPPATRPGDVPAAGVTLCLDGGELGAGAVSTVFDPDAGRVLREGVVSMNEISAFLDDRG